MSKNRKANANWYVVNGVDVRQLQTHESVISLNNTVNYAVQVYSVEFTKSTVRILRHIAQYAVKAIGVAWRGIEGIASDLGISERTVRRALRLLESLGIIRRVKTRKMSGWRGVDIIVINRLEAPVTYPEMSSECPTVVPKMSGESIKAIKTTKSKTIDDDNARTREVSSPSLEEIFVKEADAAGLPEEQRQSVLDRIKRYVDGIGSLTAYIRTSVQKAVSAARNVANKRVTNDKQTVSNNAGQAVSVRQNVRKHADKPSAQRMSFEQAVKAQLQRKDKRVQAVPAELASAAQRDKAEYERIQAEKLAERNAVSMDERMARVLALLGRA
jgi:DNA-binding transcriptional ArsR family regulator